MLNEKVLLMAQLPGLEEAKIAIEARINEIKKSLSSDGMYLAPGERPPAALDSSILGRDVIGRIKRKRQLSPEVRAKKVELIARARAKKLEAIYAQQAREKARQPPQLAAGAAAAKGKKQ
jgi:hypothetical protein